MELTEPDWDLHLYPNPTSDEIHIQMSNNEINYDYKVSIMDGNGKIVYQENMRILNEISIPISQFDNGNYHLILQQDNLLDYKSFLIQ